MGEAGGGKLFKIHTKAPGFQPHCLSKEKIRTAIEESLEKLKVTQLEVFFFHSPDPDTPLEESLQTLHELYEEGKFKHFGLSNFRVEQVQQVYDICSANKYVLPTVFQGNYNAVARRAEDELLPLLRKLKISFFAYSPLAGGFLAKSSDQFKGPLSGRWDTEGPIGQLYHKLYNKPQLIAALDKWGEAAEKAGSTRAALAYRWVVHHSAIKAENGDAVIIGASTIKQLQETLAASVSGGPLPDEVVALIEEVWETVKDEAPLDNYNG